MLSSVHFDCGEEAISALARRGVAAFKATDPVRKPHVSYFLWLYTTLNLLMGAGYFLFSASRHMSPAVCFSASRDCSILWVPSSSRSLLLRHPLAAPRGFSGSLSSRAAASGQQNQPSWNGAMPGSSPDASSR